MEREKRYLVMKNTDIEKYLTDPQIQLLMSLSSDIDFRRQQDDRGILKAAVVEADWPEYEPTWKAIENRVDGAECLPMSANQIKADVINEFVSMMIGALESGFVEKNNPTLSEIHRVAHHHVKDNYGIELPNIVEQWGQEVAELCGLGEAEQEESKINRLIDFAANAGLAWQHDDADLITESFRSLPDDVRALINDREEELGKQLCDS